MYRSYIAIEYAPRTTPRLCYLYYTVDFIFNTVNSLKSCCSMFWNAFFYLTSPIFI
jgi:hypothetical protein